VHCEASSAAESFTAAAVGGTYCWKGTAIARLCRKATSRKVTATTYEWGHFSGVKWYKEKKRKEKERR
jgi:hypothetical protein